MSTSLPESSLLRFVKLANNQYNIQFQLENNHIQLVNIVDFSMIKLIYQLNNDIFENIQMHQINDTEAIVLLLLKPLFQDLGIPQKVAYFRICKQVDLHKITFVSRSIEQQPQLLSVGQQEPLPLSLELATILSTGAELVAMRENIGVCEIESPHKINVSFTICFEETLQLPHFAEKLIRLVFNKLFKRVKQFIEMA